MQRGEDCSGRGIILMQIDHCTASGRFAEALVTCETALERFSDDPEFLERYGRLLGLNRRNADAIRFFTPLTLRDPGAGTYHFGLGLALWSQGQVEDAEAELNAALSCDRPVPEAVVPLAHLLIKCGRWEEAGEIIEKTIVDDETFGQFDGTFQALLVCRRAEIAIHRGQSALGRAYLREAVSFPGSPAPVWEMLRQLNESVDRLSKIYQVTVRGMTTDEMPPLNQRAPFRGKYVVIANNRAEALAHIQEVEWIADPKSLEIEVAIKRRRAPRREHRGVIARYPSMSFADLSPENWT